MAFSDFTCPDVLGELGPTQTSAPDLFAGVPPIPPEPKTVGALASGMKLALSVNTEKARSGWLIAPLLANVWDRYGATVGLYSGVEFDGDRAAELNGFCDFLLGTGPRLPQLAAPLVTVVEAKNARLRHHGHQLAVPPPHQHRRHHRPDRVRHRAGGQADRHLRVHARPAAG